MRSVVLSLAACCLAACASSAGTDPAILLIGEQHDAPTHQQRQTETIRDLAERGRLGAVVLEMAQQGASTRGLDAQSTQEQVQQALRWNSQAWPWTSYGPSVMAAVRAGVPVLGSNLAREEMQRVMLDDSLDRAVPPSVLQAQRQAVRDGHCGLLPEDRIAPMTRVQIARDRAMAETLVAAAHPGRTVVLLAGSGHVDPAVGVPLHLPAHLPAKAMMLPAQPSEKDHCEDMRRHMQRKS